MKKLLSLIALVLVASSAFAAPTPEQVVQGTAVSNRIANQYCS